MFKLHQALARIIVVLLLLSVTASVLPNLRFASAHVSDSVKADWSTEILWEEDFEAYANWSFPSQSWSLWDSGMGAEEQRIVDTASASGARSLRLYGRYHYGAVAARPVAVTVGAKVGFEVMIRAENNGTAPEVTGGATVAFASGSQTPDPLRQWGKIVFSSDGKIVAAGQTVSTYNVSAWYKVKEVLDVYSKTFDVWINDELKAQSLVESNPDPATDAEAMALVSDYAQQVCLFDDVKVFKMMSLMVLQQNFDDETTDQVPAGWDIVAPEYGIITVDKSTYHGELGKSAKVSDTSIRGYPSPYRNFSEQTRVIVATFAIKLTPSDQRNGGIEVYFDDGDFAGANIIFNEDGKIQYRDHNDQLILLHRSSFVYAWHTVKFIMNIRKNVYNIHVDDHLDAVNIKFTGECDQIHRIIINSMSPETQSVAHIDDLEVVRCITVPEDFPTIQEGIDAATRGDVVWVRERVYFENVEIHKRIWLIGENASTTVIDGKFSYSHERELDSVSIFDDNVTMYGFTVRNAEADAVHIESNYNTVTYNILTSALNDGIYVEGSGNLIANNTIESNNACGIHLASGEDNIVKRNIIKENKVGLRCEGWAEDNEIFQNRFVSNIVQAEDYGSNMWDDGYPYMPAEERGGGNYWSDFFSVDLYSGVDQNEHADCCKPKPDGICDSPRTEPDIPPNGRDNYPLFLIQKVTQQPPADNVTYKDNVNITAIVLEDVQIVEARIYVEKTYRDNTLIREVIAMKLIRIEQNEAGRPTYQYILKGTIPKEPWSTRISYNVSAHAYTAYWLNTTTSKDVSPWLNTTNYPLPEQYYHIIDPWPPKITGIIATPPSPNVTDRIRVCANVTEDINASQTDKVLLGYYVDSSYWTTEMIYTGRQWVTDAANTTEWCATIPRQPDDSILRYCINASDRAGNWNYPGNCSDLKIRFLANLVIKYNGVVSQDPCNVDFSVVSRRDRRTDSLLQVCNAGEEVLQWNISGVKTLPRDGSSQWLEFTPAAGTTASGACTNITINVDTSRCNNPGLYTGELAVRANGSEPQWAIVVSVWVGQIVIDKSWASIEPPNRCDVGTNKTIAFHAVWAHNASSATTGNIHISARTSDGTPAKNVTIIPNPSTVATGPSVCDGVNSSGWALFTVRSDISQNVTFTVDAVDFTYYVGTTSYSIKNFTQTACNVSIVWDCVIIVLKMTRERIDVGANSCDYISWSQSVYESDKTPFVGYPVSICHVLYEPGRMDITTSSVVDLLYGLTCFKSNTVTCIWDWIKIIAGGVSSSQVGTGQNATVWFIGIYGYDNVLFKGNWDTQLPCSLYVNVSERCKSNSTDPFVWLDGCPERWEKIYSYSTGGTRFFQVSSVVDTKYGLTKIKDCVGPLNVTWGPIPWWPFGNVAQSSTSSGTDQSPWVPFGEQPGQSNTSSGTDSPPSQFMETALVWIALAAALGILVSGFFLIFKKKGNVSWQTYSGIRTSQQKTKK